MPFEGRKDLVFCVPDFEKIEGQSVLASLTSSEPSLLWSLTDLNTVINPLPHRRLLTLLQTTHTQIRQLLSGSTVYAYGKND